MIDSVRSEEEKVILLDSGGFMPLESAHDRDGAWNRELVAKIGIEAMGAMQYDAIGLGGDDFSLGTEFLMKVASEAGISFVTTNLVRRDGMRPFGNGYAVVKAGDARVGVLSILPLGAFEGISDKHLVEGLEIVDPKTAIEAVLPELREKTDVVVLLSQYDLEKTRLLVGGLDGIDLSICSGDKDSRGGCGKKLAKAESNEPFIKTSYGGGQVGYTHLEFNPNRLAVVSRTRMIPLDGSIPDDEKIVAITGTDMKDKLEEKRQKEQMRRIKELHKLSPAEYMELLKKQSASGGEKQ
ncbi:MAG: hypothetical protein JXI32_05875 [Deltaproteobacteria bacterium]|nr:hypothetical protein [Deltaproteobacteria bacterium]